MSLSKNENEYVRHTRMVEALQRVGLCHSISAVQRRSIWEDFVEKQVTPIGITIDGFTEYIKGPFIAIAFTTEGSPISTEVYLHILPGFRLINPLVYLVDSEKSPLLFSTPNRTDIPSWLVGRTTLD